MHRRVLVASGDALVRQAVVRACALRGLVVVGEAATLVEFMEQLTTDKPDAVVIGDCFNGGGAAADIAAEDLIFKALNLLADSGGFAVVISASASVDDVARMLRPPVNGYFSYEATPGEVANGVDAVLGGAVAVDPVVAAALMEHWRTLRAQPVALPSVRALVLTPRESDILAAMADGLAAKAIAARLGVALKTVENHKIRVFEKLGVRSQAHAVTVALGRGLIRGVDPVGSRLDAFR